MLQLNDSHSRRAVLLEGNTRAADKGRHRGRFFPQGSLVVGDLSVLQSMALLIPLQNLHASHIVSLFIPRAIYCLPAVRYGKAQVTMSMPAHGMQDKNFRGVMPTKIFVILCKQTSLGGAYPDCWHSWQCAYHRLCCSTRNGMQHQYIIAIHTDMLAYICSPALEPYLADGCSLRPGALSNPPGGSQVPLLGSLATSDLLPCCSR